MLRELTSALTIMYVIAGVVVFFLAVGICNLAWSRVGKRDGMLSDAYDPDQEMRRYKSMTRNEP